MLLAIAGWVTAACVATGVGVASVSLLGEGISDSVARPLSSAEVRRALDRPPEASPSSPSSTPSSSPSSSSTARPTPGQSRLLDTAGGTVLAACSDGEATLMSWSPAQGFRGEVDERGPAPTVSVTFESDSTEFLVTVDCVSGVPRARTQTDDRGRHRGRG